MQMLTALHRQPTQIETRNSVCIQMKLLFLSSLIHALYSSFIRSMAFLDTMDRYICDLLRHIIIQME